MTINNIDQLLIGTCGDHKLDEKINNISNHFTEKPINHFKNQCGDYYTSSGFALQAEIKSLEILEIKEERAKYALIINHYRDINYSIYLIEK